MESVYHTGGWGGVGWGKDGRVSRVEKGGGVRYMQQTCEGPLRDGPRIPFAEEEHPLPAPSPSHTHDAHANRTRQNACANRTRKPHAQNYASTTHTPTAHAPTHAPTRTSQKHTLLPDGGTTGSDPAGPATAPATAGSGAVWAVPRGPAGSVAPGGSKALLPRGAGPPVWVGAELRLGPACPPLPVGGAGGRVAIASGSMTTVVPRVG